MSSIVEQKRNAYLKEMLMYQVMQSSGRQNPQNREKHL